MRSCDACPARRVTGVEAPVDRRELLRVGAAGAAALLAAGCGGGGAPAGETDAGGTPIDAGEPSEGSAGACTRTCTTGSRVLVLTFARYPALQNVGGSALVQAPGYVDPACGGDQVIVIQPAAGQYRAFSASCTHACCTVRFTGAGFSCPCHMSVFGLDGKVKSGPAPAPLPELDVCSDACGVTITIP
jgi:nitrite reductase/ring-hydroxylating ferredoxin subunit